MFSNREPAGNEEPDIAMLAMGTVKEDTIAESFPPAFQFLNNYSET